MWQQTVQDVLQKTVNQKIEYVTGALPVDYLFIIFCIYVLYEWSTEFLFVVKNMPVYWNLCVVMCVSESKRGRLTRKESWRFNKRKKREGGVSLKLSAGQCIALCFISNCLFLCSMTTLPWRCQLQSAVSVITNTFLGKTIHSNRILGLTFK